MDLSHLIHNIGNDADKAPMTSARRYAQPRRVHVNPETLDFAFNRSRIKTVTVAAITSNLQLVAAPGNVALAAGAAGLDRDCMVNVSQVSDQLPAGDTT